MLVDGARELLADILTMNPGLSAISSASSILDASNYTIQAITFGKGAQSYSRHAHSIDVSSYSITNNCITVYALPNSDTSSYQTSNSGDLLPEFEHPHNTRLETSSTQTPIPFLDMGHNINAILTSATNGLGISSILAGCYPPSGGIEFRVLDSTGGILTSGILHSKYNLDQVIDASGFITMTASSADHGNLLEDLAASSPFPPYQGLILTAETNWSSTGNIQYKTLVSGCDLGAAALYGGIYEVGLWYIDIKRMLSEGKNPPFAFNALNNERRYKLFAKKVFTKDLAYHADSEGSDTPANYGGLNSFTVAAEADFLNHTLFNNLGFSWTIRF